MSDKPGAPTGPGRSVQPAKKPSPLSKQSVDDDDADAVYGGSDNGEDGRTTPTPGQHAQAADKLKKQGLSGKLRKALSFSTLSDVQQAEMAAAERGPPAVVRTNRVEGALPPGVNSTSSGDTNASSGSTRSTSPPRTPDNGASPLPASSAASISSRRSRRPPLSGENEGGSKRGLFNRKFNSSTDNISISSTVSSASVMLRKVGNLGKLARRHSLMGLTNMFNKDKEREGREGLHGDDFGAPSAVVDDSAVGKGKKSKTKKGAPAAASITHATVELESGAHAEGGMTPAASYVRQHQLQMKQQAEAEAKAAKAAKERAELEAKSKSKNKTTDDVMENRQKMIEKEKERLKSKRGWRKKLGVGGGSISEAPTGLETTYAEPDASNVDQHGAPVYSYAPDGSGGFPPQAAGFDDSGYDPAFDEEGLEPPHMPGAGGAEESGDEYETDSLRHWGEGIERSRANAANFKLVKGILKSEFSK